jgi:hypothetical protein
MLYVLCPFVQTLIDDASSGDVGAVHTLLSGSAESVAGFINEGDQVRETCCNSLRFFLTMLVLCFVFEGGIPGIRMG